MHRHTTAVARVSAAAIIIVTTLTLAAISASAHVTIKPDNAPKGSFSIINFSVPNEEADANTVKLEVTLPAAQPIAFVSVKPMTGWDITTETTKLATPIKSDDGDVTERVSKVTWTATAGGLLPGQFDLFTISAGPLPTKAKTMTFKAIQTYSNGDVVSWIQTSVKGAPEPEHPAPVLRLTKATSD
ncbi:MAG TPA: YcnI family protein [Acidimicrobiia bacterium]|jgi:uncharacterized protein YcnI